VNENLKRLNVFPTILKKGRADPETECEDGFFIRNCPAKRLGLRIQSEKEGEKDEKPDLRTQGLSLCGVFVFNDANSKGKTKEGVP